MGINYDQVTKLCTKLNNDEFKNNEVYMGYREDPKQYFKYQTEEDRIEAQFKAEALEAVGLKDHERADKVYKLAWDYGHANGLGEVFNHLIGLAGLFHDD